MQVHVPFVGWALVGCRLQLFVVCLVGPQAVTQVLDALLVAMLLGVTLECAPRLMRPLCAAASRWCAACAARVRRREGSRNEAEYTRVRCEVCFLPFRDGDARVLACGHLYCSACAAALEACAFCAAKVRKRSTRVVYLG